MAGNLPQRTPEERLQARVAECLLSGTCRGAGGLNGHVIERGKRHTTAHISCRRAYIQGHS